MILLIHQMIADIKGSSVILVILLVQFSQCYSSGFFLTSIQVLTCIACTHPPLSFKNIWLFEIILPIDINNELGAKLIKTFAN